MKPLILLLVLLASCHGKQIVPAGEPEGIEIGDGDSMPQYHVVDYGMMVIDSQHKLREVPPMMIFYGKIDTTPPRNKMIEIERTNRVGSPDNYEFKVSGETKKHFYIDMSDSIKHDYPFYYIGLSPGTVIIPPKTIIIHNTDTITAYPGDTVRIKN